MKYFFSILLITLLTIGCSVKDEKLKTEMIEIKSLSGDAYDDLRFFKQILKDKRIVQLGESGHGIAEYFILKTRLVKYLHEELGYNILAVEGSLADCSSAFMDIESLSDTLLMQGCFYPTWNFKEALPLFSYVKSTLNTPNPLILTGFDNIPTGKYFSVFFKSIISDLDSSKLSAFENVNTRTNVFINGINANTFSEYKRSILDSLSVCERFVWENKPAIQNRYSESPHVIDYLLRSLANIKSTISIEKEEYSRNTMERMRDKLMGENLIWLADSVFGQQKIIVWAHNAHVSKAYSQIPDLGEGRSFLRQGEYVYKKFENQSYTIGLYCYEGSGYAFFLNGNYELETPGTFSLESKMKNSQYDISFLNIKETSKSDTSFNWLYDSIPSYEWGRFEQLIIPRNHYDGLLFINKVSHPTLLNQMD